VEFMGDTARSIAWRKARWEALVLAAQMMRGRGPCVLVDGGWVYGLSLRECAAAIDGQLRGR